MILETGNGREVGDLCNKKPAWNFTEARLGPLVDHSERDLLSFRRVWWKGERVERCSAAGVHVIQASVSRGCKRVTPITLILASGHTDVMDHLLTMRRLSQSRYIVIRLYSDKILQQFSTGKHRLKRLDSHVN